MRARLDARRRLAHRQPVTAHVALADNSLARVVFGGIVRTGERAILAADALIVEMADNSGVRVFLVGVNRTGVEARRVQAVVACGRHVLENGQARACRR